MADLFLPFKSFFFFFFFFFKVLGFCSVGPELLQFEIAFGFWFDFLLFPAQRFSFFLLNPLAAGRSTPTAIHTMGKSINDTESTAVYTQFNTNSASREADGFSFEFPALNWTESNSARQFRLCQPMNSNSNQLNVRVLLFQPRKFSFFASERAAQRVDRQKCFKSGGPLAVPRRPISFSTPSDTGKGKNK
jgi:hypothetical protein